MKNELEKPTALEEDRVLLERLHEVEKKTNFHHGEYAIFHYVSPSPIPLSLPFNELLRAFKKSVLRECNTYYASSLGCKKEDLINKKTLDDLLPNNFFNLAIFKTLLKNRAIEGSESLQYDVKGDEHWFLNFVSLEIENETILGFWGRKREITHEKKAIRHFIEALLMMLETRDTYTADHQKRVGQLAKRIATEYGLEGDQIAWVELAAKVHDIGKIAIPSEILSKPGRLSSAEFALIKEHPEVGYRILKNFEEMGSVPEIVYQHHERLDGSGYPRGLKGDEILLETKILSVADVVEAMSSHRPYRPAHSIEVALNEIKDQRGVKLDPKAVDICVALFEKKNFQF